MPDDDLPPDTGPEPEDQQEQLTRFLRNFLVQEILPQLQATLDTRLIEIRSWVSEQITPLPLQAPPTPQALAEQVSRILGPQLQRELDPIIQMVRGIETRLTVLEGRPAPELVSPMQAAGSAAAAADTPGAPADRVMGFAALADTLMDLVGTKLFPMINQFQQMKQGNKLFSMDPAAIEAFRKTNPAYATILAQQLAPDATVAGLMAQLPFTLATGIATGMKARVLASQLVATPQSGPGGGAWPGTLGPGSPALSPSTPGAPSPGPTAPRPGASMQSRRPSAARTGRPGSWTKPTNGARPAAPVKLTDALR